MARRTVTANAASKQASALHVAAPTVEIVDDEAVRARVAAGELVPLRREPTPVRDHVVAQLRANLTRRGPARGTA